MDKTAHYSIWILLNQGYKIGTRAPFLDISLTNYINHYKGSISGYFLNMDRNQHKGSISGYFLNMDRTQHKDTISGYFFNNSLLKDIESVHRLTNSVIYLTK